MLILLTLNIDDDDDGNSDGKKEEEVDCHITPRQELSQHPDNQGLLISIM